MLPASLPLVPTTSVPTALLMRQLLLLMVRWLVTLLMRLVSWFEQLELLLLRLRWLQQKVLLVLEPQLKHTAIIPPTVRFIKRPNRSMKWSSLLLVGSMQQCQDRLHNWAARCTEIYFRISDLELQQCLHDGMMPYSTMV